MAKPGRKRKVGARRKPSGQLTYEPRVNPTPEMLKRRMDGFGHSTISAELDSPLAALHARSIISMEMMQAGERLRCLRVAVWGDVFPKSSVYGDVSALSMSDEAFVAKKRAYDGAMEALKSAGRYETRVVLSVVVERRGCPNVADLGAFLRGMHALKQHFEQGALTKHRA